MQAAAGLGFPPSPPTLFPISSYKSLEPNSSYKSGR